MGYRHIPNLYKKRTAQVILNLNECYALEKINGTSTHIGWRRKAQDNAKPSDFFYFSGGIKHEVFMTMLSERFPLLEENISRQICYNQDEVIFYGEAYGGKCQKMSGVYGPLNFIVFEVKVNDTWLGVECAKTWADSVGLPFVHFERGPATLEWLNTQRDKPSEIAARNGLGVKYGEGIVIHPICETDRDRWGNRIIAKHKSEKYKETRTPRKIDPEKARMWKKAREIAEEWCIKERLMHVLDHLAARGIVADSMNHTGAVVKEMIQDVKDESIGEVVWSKKVEKAIGARTAKLFKRYLNEQLEEMHSGEF